MNDNIIWLLICIFAFLIGYIDKMKDDIGRMNKKLDFIAKQLGEPDTITDDLKELFSEGKEIEAIKKYRIDTGAGLLEAK